MSIESLLKNELYQIQEQLRLLDNLVRMWGNQGANELFSGHGYQRFGDGDFRLDRNGIQILTQGSAAFGLFFFNDTFQVSPSAVVPKAAIQGSVDSTSATIVAVARGSSAGNSSVTIASNDTTPGSESGTITISTIPAGTGSQEVKLLMTNVIGGAKRVEVTNGSASIAVFCLANDTVDPTFTLRDGDMWYRTDTDRFRVRKNSTTVSLAYDTDVTDHTGDTTDAHDASAISVLDTGGNFTGTDVEAVLAELATAGGGWNPTVTTQTGTYTAVDGDVVICNSTTAFTVTLPLATTANRRIVIKNINTGTVTVDGNGSETIDDQLSVTLAQYDSITVISDGTEWWII